MNTPTLRVSIAFAGEPDLKLLAEGDTVDGALFENPSYTNLPMTKAQFQTALNEFRTSLAEKKDKGPAGTATKNEKRTILVGKMKELAYYVQTACNNVLSVLLSSGFKAVSTNRTSAPLAAPVIEKLVRGQSGEVLLTAKSERNARGFEREMAVVAADGTIGEFTSLGFTKGCRRLSTTGLTPLQRYAFRIRALGGSTEQSDWSEVVTIACV